MAKRSASPILFVSAEAAPLAKVGGLADVASALPKTLKSMGHDVRIIMPDYGMIENNAALKITPLLEFDVQINPFWTERAYVRTLTLDNNLTVYLVGCNRWFNESTSSETIYRPGAEPYIFFNRAVVSFIERYSEHWLPRVVHCNDWHTGLIPVYLKTLENPLLDQIATVFTVHNLAFQGLFPHETLHWSGLPEHLFTSDQLEFFGQFSFMKGGLVFADMVNTVSPTYASEIQTETFGEGLNGLLSWLNSRERLTGILNGIDTDLYNPETDKQIAAAYSTKKMTGKQKCKAELQKTCGWKPNANTVVIGMVGRLTDQKGMGIIKTAFAKMLQLPVQFVVLGTGDPAFERFLTAQHKKNRNKVCTTIGFDPKLAQKIYAGADLFLMPSQFEPCGLGQMIAMRYGTLPVVRATGGLADTVTDAGVRFDKGNGFTFTEFTPTALTDALKRATTAFQSPTKWPKLVQRAMTTNWSWKTSADAYVNLYQHARDQRKAAELAYR